MSKLTLECWDVNRRHGTGGSCWTLVCSILERLICMLNLPRLSPKSLWYFMDRLGHQKFFLQSGLYQSCADVATVILGWEQTYFEGCRGFHEMALAPDPASVPFFSSQVSGSRYQFTDQPKKVRLGIVPPILTTEGEESLYPDGDIAERLRSKHTSLGHRLHLTGVFQSHGATPSAGWFHGKSPPKNGFISWKIQDMDHKWGPRKPPE